MALDPSSKLPVPGPWQAAVKAAIADTARREALPPAAIAVTRVEAGSGGDLAVWLLAAGRSRRYRVTADGSRLHLEPDRA